MKKTASKKATKRKPLNERAARYVAADKKALEKYELERVTIVTFPQSAQVPFLGKLAVKLLKWSRGVITVEFQDKQ